MKRTILIVDDALINRSILVKLLCEDYDTIQAENGEVALQIMRENYKQISAVLLDLFMPVMSGFEVLRTVKDDSELSQIPIIVITGSDDNETELNALSLGAHDYITKPFNPRLVNTRLKNVIRLRETAMTVNAYRRDRLTGLYTRDYFLELIGSLLPLKPAGYYVIAYMDIVNFKIINDRYGNAMGDKVLIHVAHTYQEGFEKMGGICCRLVADRFAAFYPAEMLSTVTLSDIKAEAAKLNGMLSPITISTGRYVIDDLSLSPNLMVDRASMALQTIKGRFDVTEAFFDERMRARILSEQTVISEMESALAEGQFEPWLQPQYDHSTGALIGAEALARWRHPQKGLISPIVFIPIFERNGFVYELDKYIWKSVCVILRKWLDEGKSPVPVSVNISRFDINHSDLIDIIDGLTNQYNIPRNLLRLEITESAFSKSTDKVISVVIELIKKGFIVEIDDFGSGYSSLNSLKDVPAQVLKLDMKFLKMEDGKGTEQGEIIYARSGYILESIVRMAKWLNMEVIAEGVETEKQADYLSSIGCSFIQGYLYAKPMPIEEFERLPQKTTLKSVNFPENIFTGVSNNSFWDPNSLDSLVFNAFVGAAAVFEYTENGIELLRASKKFARLFMSEGFSVVDAMRINWAEHINDEDKKKLKEALNKSIESKEDAVCNFCLYDLPISYSTVFLKVFLRVIAIHGDSLLVYIVYENKTRQHIAEQARLVEEKQMLLLNDCFKELLSSSSLESTMNSFLARISDYFCASRASVYLFDEINWTISCTNEVCALGEQSQMANFQEVPFDCFDKWWRIFEKNECIILEDSDAVQADKSFSKKQMEFLSGTRSLIAVPIKYNNVVVGFYEVINSNANRKQLKFLQILSSFLGALYANHVMLRRKDDERKAFYDFLVMIPNAFVRLKLIAGNDYAVVFANNAFCQIRALPLGYFSFGNSGSIFDAVHPEDLHTVHESFAYAISTGKPCAMEYRTKTAEGIYKTQSAFINATNEEGDVYINAIYTNTF